MRGVAGHWRLGAVALVLGALLVVLGRAWFERELLPPIAESSTASVPVAAATGSSLGTAAEAPASPAQPERVQAPSGRAAVHGSLRLATGEPLPGFTVQLSRLDAWRPARSPRPLDLDAVPSLLRPVPTTTGDDGAFAFEELEAGRYRVSVDAKLGTLEEEFVLAAAERRVVEFTVRGALVNASVHAGESTVPFARYVVWRDGDDDRSGRANEKGEFRLVLPSGTYEVRLLSDVWPVAPIGVHTVVVPTGVARTAWRLLAAGTDLEVTVRDGDGNAAGAFTARLDGVLAANGERAVREFSGTAGRAVFECIPEGEWKVTVRAPEFVSPPPRELATRRVLPRERLDFVVAPAAVVPLALLRPDRTPFRVDPELLPWLAVGDQHVPCTALGAVERGAMPKQIGYLGVPPGRATLTLADRSGADGIEYLPFEPMPPLAIDVVCFATPPQQVVVTPRAEVDLRGCEAGGREDFAARVQVFAGDREVRGRPRLPAQRWFGWLPPGDYRVVVTRPTGALDHALRVDRADVQLRLRP